MTEPLPPYLAVIPEVDAAYHADPFSKEYTKQGAPTSVREALGYQRSFARDLASVKTFGDDVARRVQTFRQVAAAPLFMFEQKVCEAIIAAPEHPPTVFGPGLLPFSSLPAVFIFDGGMTVVSHGSNEELSLITFAGGSKGFVRSVFPDGTPWPSGEDMGDAGLLLKMLAFLRGPCASVERVRQPRADRRRLEKAELPPPEVSVVTLRRLAQAAPESSAKTEPGRFHFQWWVRSHYREQWFPSEQAHKTVLIVEHVKGPAGAPFRPRVYRVAR